MKVFCVSCEKDVDVDDATECLTCRDIQCVPCLIEKGRDCQCERE